jgi:DNA phosphorothioation-associated putative methyltransferase
VYPDFDREGHPALTETFVANLRKLDIGHRDYRTSANAPVLHRKETFVATDYPMREQFESLTRAEESAGLLESPELIGFANQWNERLAAKGFSVSGHDLRPQLGGTDG